MIHTDTKKKTTPQPVIVTVKRAFIDSTKTYTFNTRAEAENFVSQSDAAFKKRVISIN